MLVFLYEYKHYRTSPNNFHDKYSNKKEVWLPSYQTRARECVRNTSMYGNTNEVTLSLS